MLSTIGKYEIRSEIGRGGFGRVYLAFDASMSRQVAIKILASESDSELLTRFHDEARTTGKLRHKNIVTVYEFGENAGVPFLVMELLEGQTLKNFIGHEDKMPLLGKMRVIAEAAEGVRYAHNQGVIHRDVTPSNIMLLPDGGVKIMDFGIARLADLGRTRNGELIGTTMYMAPEQFKGVSADAQTDIYSFGIVCYELFSGSHPFPDENDKRFLYRAATRHAQPLHQAIPNFPEALSNLIDRAMAQDRDVRYASMEDFILDTEPILADLRGKRAAELMEEVQLIGASGDKKRVGSLIEQILKLEPTNASARQIRNQFQNEKLAGVLRLRSEVLLQEGLARLAAQQYGEAIQSFETILRVDAGCKEAREGFEKAHALLNAWRDRGRFLSQGKQEALAGNLANALQHARSALAIDPTSTEAQTFERDILVRVALSESGQLVDDENFDAADAVIDRLSPSLTGHSDIQAERERIRSSRERAIQERKRQALAARLKSIEHARLQRNYKGALALVEEARLEFGEFSGFAEVVACIREEQAAAKRTAVVQQAVLQSEQMVEEQNFEAAIEKLDKALLLYPREKSLLRSRERAGLALAKHIRETHIQEAIAEAHALMEEEDPAEALAAVNAACERFPGTSDLETLATSIRAGIAARCAEAEWMKMRTDALASMDSDPRAALALLRNGGERHQGREGYAELLEVAQRKNDLAERTSAVKRAIEDKNWRMAGAKLESSFQLGMDAATYEGLVALITHGRKLDKLRAGCSRCGASLLAKARFCDICGSLVTDRLTG